MMHGCYFILTFTRQYYTFSSYDK